MLRFIWFTLHFFYSIHTQTQKAAYTTVANWVVEPASASFFVLPHKNEEIKINTAQNSKIAQEKRSTTTVDEPNLDPESNQTTDQQCKQHINNADYSLLLSFSHHCCVKCEEKKSYSIDKRGWMTYFVIVRTRPVNITHPHVDDILKKNTNEERKKNECAF